jgi:hypothetical protein
LVAVNRQLVGVALCFAKEANNKGNPVSTVMLIVMRWPTPLAVLPFSFLADSVPQVVSANPVVAHYSPPQASPLPAVSANSVSKTLLTALIVAMKGRWWIFFARMPRSPMVIGLGAVIVAIATFFSAQDRATDTTR